MGKAMRPLSGPPGSAAELLYQSTCRRGKGGKKLDGFDTKDNGVKYTDEFDKKGNRIKYTDKLDKKGKRIKYIDKLDESDEQSNMIKYKKKTLEASHTPSALVQGGPQRLDFTTTVTPVDAPFLPMLSVPPIGNASAVQPYGKRGSATVQTVLRLIKEISQIFHQVPYVKAIAAIVEQIITISDEVQANKDMVQELLENIMYYSGVVFKDLKTHQDGDVFDLKDHLIEITSVFTSVYDLLQSMTASRLDPVIFRDDIAAKIAKHGRRLHTIIVAFQVKSLRDLGKTLQNPVENNVKIDAMAVHDRIRSPRSKPQIILGRKTEIKAVVNAILQTNQVDLPRIPILGSGGIGKTTLALSVMYDDYVRVRFGSERVFVSCEAASSVDLFVGELATSLKIRTKKINNELFESVLRRLGKHPLLLVLDNFETTWDPPHTRTEIESLLAAITSIKTLACIVTMRGLVKPSGTEWSTVLPPLQPVDLQSAIAIFKAISLKADDYSIKLVQAVDCVPLAVTLIAHLASVDGETTEALWSRWQEESTSMVERGQDCHSSLEISVQTSLSSPRMQRDPSAEAFLSLLSLLPDGMSPVTQRICETELSEVLSVNKAISTLRQNALVYDDSNGTLRVLSPIRLFICAHRPPSPESRQILYNHYIKLAHQGSSYHDSIIRLQLEREVGNITTILLDTLRDTNAAATLQEVIGAVVNFCHYTYVTGLGSSESLAAEAVNRLQLLQDSRSIPSSGKNTPWPYRLLPLIKRQAKVTHSANGQYSGIDMVLKLQADCLGCWGQMLSRRSRFELAQEKFNLAKDLHIKAGDISGQASDILNIALLLSRDPKNFDEALQSFQDAIQLHEMANDTSGKAHGLLGAGHLLRVNFRFVEARERFDSAAALFADIKCNTGHFSALNGIGSTMQACSKFSEAEQYFTEAVQLSTETGDVVSQAEGLAGLALSFLFMSRLAQAQETIEKAIQLRQPFFEAEHLHILARVLIARVQFERAEEFLCLSRSLCEDSGDKVGLWYGFYHLAVIAFYRGETRMAEQIARKELYLPSTLHQEAHLLCLNGVIFTRHGDLGNSLPLLTKANQLYSQVNSLLDQAICSQYIGVIHLREANFQLAMEHFTQALRTHTQIGNVGDQADSLNRICQTLLIQGQPQEAFLKISESLALHTETEDFSGQGDDLYVLANIYLAENKPVDAEQTIRQALEMHKRSESKYGQARDLASLSEIIWQARCGIEGSTSEDSVDALSILRQAIDLFKDVSAFAAARHCGKLERRMTGEDPGMVGPMLLSCM